MTPNFGYMALNSRGKEGVKWSPLLNHFGERLTTYQSALVRYVKLLTHRRGVRATYLHLAQPGV